MTQQRPMFGFLNVHKPVGMTSRDVVNRVQRRVRPAKCGHAGTLDPLATGVLVIAVGPATRLIQYAQQTTKCYIGTFELGKFSDTEDTEGQIEDVPVNEHLSRQDLESHLAGLTGRIMQQPPAFSALKVAGKRAYKLARTGCEVELKKRPVTIHQLSLIAYDFPYFTLSIACGAGTYVRSLGRDLARAVGTEAVMTSLQRTRVGPFDLETAVTLEQIATDLGSCLLPPQSGIQNLPAITISSDQAQEFIFGRPLVCDFASDVEEFATYDEQGRLIAIVSPRDNALWPTCNFAHHYVEGAQSN